MSSKLLGGCCRWVVRGAESGLGGDSSSAAVAVDMLSYVLKRQNQLDVTRAIINPPKACQEALRCS